LRSPHRGCSRAAGPSAAAVGALAVIVSISGLGPAAFVTWPQVVGFGFDEPDAIWESGAQAYLDLDEGEPTRVRIGAVTPDFPAAVRHYSAGAHEVTWPIA